MNVLQLPGGASLSRPNVLRTQLTEKLISGRGVPGARREELSSIGNSHDIVYIDESGNGAPCNGIGSYWVSAAVLIRLDEKQIVDSGIQSVLANRFRPYSREVRGANIPHDLLPGQSIENVAQDIASLCDAVHAHIWVVASRHGKIPPIGVPPENSKPKGIARQLLFERINGFFKHGYAGTDDCMTVWDISDLEELKDFSANVAAFRNVYDQSQLCPSLAPAVLGGLSHDWKGLQIADMVANFSLHYLGMKRMLPDARKAKSDAFARLFYPRLQRNSNGDIEGVGWKVWD